MIRALITRLKLYKGFNNLEIISAIVILIITSAFIAFYRSKKVHVFNWKCLILLTVYVLKIIFYL